MPKFGPVQICLHMYLIQGALSQKNNYKFGMYIPSSHCQLENSNVLVDIPLSLLCPQLTKAQLLSISRCHYMLHVNHHMSKDEILTELL